MATSRDANDPRDLMKGMRKETEREFESREATDSGGAEHQTPGERAGRTGGALDREAARGMERATAQQDDAGKLRTPGGGEERSRGRGAPLPRIREGEEP